MTPDKNEIFFTNDNEKRIYGTWTKNNCNFNLTANELNVTIKHIRKIINRIKNRQLKNNTEEKQMDVKSTSILYDANGNVINKWVKSDTSKNYIKKLVNEYINEYSKKLPKYIPVKNNLTYENKLVVYPLADLHLGMLSWEPETGNDYNTKNADQLVRKLIAKIIDRSPSCEECVIANLGDFFHVDNQVNRTERSGNVLDCDSRYAKIVQCGIKIIRYFIEYALQKHKKVTLINCIGNHDDLGEIWFDIALKNIYENEKRLNIISDPTQRKYYVYGNNLLGFTHGNDVKNQNLPIVMASERKLDWGVTQNHYWYTGHWHSDRIIEVGDCKVESVRAICAKDAWSTAKGYLSGRDIKAIVIDRIDGECERYTLKI